ncbi:MAG TPA: 23S rRNA (adenine(2030)-N(6))-methyltransferase RlmJ, partial [Bordetella sp.]|nr:23S rRNA (adenine(2030)-N(6))-methyltransferase RlmJ [Bordetella sp.]
MFSYRHAFHAGNHADVLKHAMLVHTLDYLNRKDAPYWVVDTHAGAGLYALDSAWAAQNAEFADGIGRLWQRDDLPPLLADYVARVQRY